MNAYVVGAGVSKGVGYPLGSELFDEIDKYVRESGNLIDRFDYREKWPELVKWLDTNTDPLIVHAYRAKKMEHLFTLLDLASELREDALVDAAWAERDSDERRAKFSRIEAFDLEIRNYQEYRRVLLWALEHYFEWRHHEDGGSSKEKEWQTLRAFADRLQPDDVVITFNYDATLERILLERGKWSPSDGYGFDIVLQQSRFDQAKVRFDRSQVVILHLHGATGWYRRPAFAPDYVLPPHGGALPAEAFGPAPIFDTKISLDPQFLQALGIFNVDACLPDALPVADEHHVVLHPSFLKDYETDESNSHVFVELWQKAAETLRKADHTYIIGYSLPKADAAVLTLLLTNTRRGSVTVVNSDKHAVMRLGRLFSSNPFGRALTLEEWLQAGGPSQSGSTPWEDALSRRGIVTTS